MRNKGKISSWNDKKGFGFITPFNGEKRIFIHIKEFNNRKRRPEEGVVVTYTLSTDKQGRPCASEAVMVGDSPAKKSNTNISMFLIIGAFAFLLAVSFFTISAQMPFEIFILYLVGSLLTFIMYALDKSSALKGARRTPENTLHLLSIAGGWPGANIAQQKFRHKTRKQPFRFVFWVTVLLNCGVFLWLLTPTGKQFIDTII